MFITPSFKKSLIVEQFQGNYLKDIRAKIFSHWFFSKKFTIERWWLSDVRNVKKMGGHRLRFGENMPRRTPKSE